MSGWDSRIKIRIDAESAFGGVPEPRLNAGEFAAATQGSRVSIRIGDADDQRFSSAPVLMAGAPGFAPLVVADGSASSGGDGGLVWWDGSTWQAGGTAIQFSTDSPSGVLTYTASTDTWATDTSSVVPSSLDGGAFAVNLTAPAFSASYQPSIGDT